MIVGEEEGDEEEKEEVKAWPDIIPPKIQFFQLD